MARGCGCAAQAGHAATAFTSSLTDCMPREGGRLTVQAALQVIDQLPVSGGLADDAVRVAH